MITKATVSFAISHYHLVGKPKFLSTFAANVHQIATIIGQFPSDVLLAKAVKTPRLFILCVTMGFEDLLIPAVSYAILAAIVWIAAITAQKWIIGNPKRKASYDHLLPNLLGGIIGGFIVWALTFLVADHAEAISLGTVVVGLASIALVCEAVWIMSKNEGVISNAVSKPNQEQAALQDSLIIEHKKPFGDELKRMTETRLRPSGDESRIDIIRNDKGEKTEVHHTVYQTDEQGVRRISHHHEK